MQHKGVNFLSVLFCFFLVFSCAKRGSITGGPKDEEPPVFVKASPPNLSTSFKAKEIRIYFDELVTINDAQKVIVSPPMENKPDITPIGYPAKFIRVRFKDSLLPETTYNINFGSSIVDNNEKNELGFFQYVFSTGKVLDSLTFKGSVRDAFSQVPEKNISVFLYEVNEEFKDSVVFNGLPRYISNTLDSTAFEFKNLKAGKYKLVALQDKSKNYLFEPKQDKIGFLSETISIPEDSIAELTLFKEEPEFKFVRAKQLSKNKFSVGYEGKLIEPKLSLFGIETDTIKTTFFKEPEKDTLNFWVKPFFAQDSILILAQSKIKTDTITSRYKDQYKDSLNVSAVSRTLKLKEDLVLTANTPFYKVNNDSINLIDQDTLPVSFKHKIDDFKNELNFSFDKKEETNYVLQLLPGAITDFIDNKNDTINIKINTLAEAEYGKLVLSISNLEGAQNIIQLLQGEKIKEEITVSENTAMLTFESLKPGDYTVRFIFDENKNGIQDTGNYLQNLQPEKVFYYPKPITVRSNWDVQQDINLQDAEKWMMQSILEKQNLEKERKDESKRGR